MQLRLQLVVIVSSWFQALRELGMCCVGGVPDSSSALRRSSTDQDHLHHASTNHLQRPHNQLIDNNRPSIRQCQLSAAAGWAVSCFDYARRCVMQAPCVTTLRCYQCYIHRQDTTQTTKTAQTAGWVVQRGRAGCRGLAAHLLPLHLEPLED